jgi:hypothetical protein
VHIAFFGQFDPKPDKKEEVRQKVSFSPDLIDPVFCFEGNFI